MLNLNAGFTLIEIMIVLVIISVLATISVMILDGHSVLDNTRKVRANKQLKNLQRALALYYFDFAKYPAKLIQLYNNSENKIYLEQEYINNKLKNSDYKSFSYSVSSPDKKSYNVNLILESDIKLILSPEQLIETNN
ncbi:MAG: type II secretion system protein [Bacillota bacterium]